MISAAIIGVTGYGNVQFNQCIAQVRAGAMELKAAVVVNPHQAEGQIEVMREINCPVFADSASMWQQMRNQVDLCIIPAPIALHAALSIEAMEAGANVLVEKPLCGSLAEADAMMAAEARTGKFIAVGFQDLYDPVIHLAKQRLLAGAIGRIERIRGHALWPRPLSYYQRNNWAGKIRNLDGPVYDSPFQNAMAHFIAMELFMASPEFNELAVVDSLEGDLFRAYPIESFDTGALRMRTEQGIELFYAGTHACQVTTNPIIHVQGSCGSLRFEVFKHCQFRIPGSEPEILPLTPHNHLQTRVVEQAMRRVRDPGAFVCTTAMAIRHLQVIARLHHAVPIQTVPAPFVTHMQATNGSRLCICGIDADIAMAADKLRLLRELPLPWLPVPALSATAVLLHDETETLTGDIHRQR